MSSSESVGDDPVSADDSGSESGGTWRFLREVAIVLRTGAVGRGQDILHPGFLCAECLYGKHAVDQ